MRTLREGLLSGISFFFSRKIRVWNLGDGERAREKKEERGEEGFGRGVDFFRRGFFW